MKVRLAIATCCAALAFPASAAAVTCAPPGNAGVDQYFETIPGSVCNHSSTGPPSGHHGSLPPGTSSQLSKQGAVGQAVARLVSSTGRGGSNASAATGSATGGGSHKNAKSSAKSSGTPVSGSGRGPLSGILHPVLTGSSSGGVGVLLPVFLGGALVLVLLAMVVRRRLGSSGPGT